MRCAYPPYTLPKSERFPRTYRSTLTQRLMDAALDLQEALVAAQSREGRSRVSALRNAAPAPAAATEVEAPAAAEPAPAEQPAG